MIIKKLQRFIGQNIYDVSQELEKLVIESGYILNVEDPRYNSSSIDINAKRLNAVTNVEGYIVDYRIG